MNTNILPKVFLEKMHKMLGDEFDNFLSSYDKPDFHALRINTLKSNSENILNKYNFRPVSWTENGYYYNDDITPGKHPYHEAGVYYIQEPSAMSPAYFLDAKPYDTVLDLCAAPGGKSTQIACQMNGHGLFISNEFQPSRAKILSENIERMGITNAIVTNETSDNLAKHFPEFFDKIMIDAPCSGEGMFRKNPSACDKWSTDNVIRCLERQIDILHNASLMLKAGGKMVYSTCTFSLNENEGAVAVFLDNHPDFYLEPVNASDGLSCGEIWGTIRLWPHLADGEGHFFAVLRKKEAYSEKDNDYKIINGISKKECKECMDFLKLNLNDSVDIFAERKIIKFGSQIYLVPDNTPELNGIKVLRPGLHLGTMLNNRFEPSHSLALSLNPNQVRNNCRLTLSDKTIYDYLNGQTFPYEGDKGWYLISVDDYSAGWGKLSGNTMKNHYPKGLRKNIPATDTFM